VRGAQQMSRHGPHLVMEFATNPGHTYTSHTAHKTRRQSLEVAPTILAQKT